RRSIAAEVIMLLRQNAPTEQELKRRRRFALKLKRLRAAIPPVSGNFPSTEEMIREDPSR
ncbi:MAG: hypothetical protein ACRD51_08080, partial [Candidatus Acidiferrum sp.]